MTIEIKPGDAVRLRKAHHSGSYEWEVVRVGADIGLKCLECQQRVLLARDVFGRRVKEFIFNMKSSGKLHTKSAGPVVVAHCSKQCYQCNGCPHEFGVRGERINQYPS
jgi:hypothetical protein